MTIGRGDLMLARVPDRPDDADIAATVDGLGLAVGDTALAPLPLHKEDDGERFPSDLTAAKKLLEKTQRACDEVLADARKRADLILKEAEDLVPDAELEDLEAQREQVRLEIEKLKSEAEIFRRRFQSMLKDQNDILETDLF